MKKIRIVTRKRLARRFGDTIGSFFGKGTPLFYIENRDGHGEEWYTNLNARNLYNALFVVQ